MNFDLFFFFCARIADRICSSLTENSAGYRPVRNFLQSKVKLRIQIFFICLVRTPMALRCFRELLFELTTVAS